MSNFESSAASEQKFETEFRAAADREKLYVQLDKRTDGTYSEPAVRLAYAMYLAGQPTAAANEQGKCRRCSSLSNMVKSLEGELTHHRGLAGRYNEAITTLDSERAANSRLTEELGRAQLALDQLGSATK